MSNQKIQPPKRSLHFFRWFCRPEITEDIEGDLFEKFHRNAEEKGIKKAKRTFTWQVILLLRPGIIRNSFNFSENQLPMLRQNLKISWRTLKRNKGFAWINIGGLALGIMASLLIGLWIHDELSFNKDYMNYEWIVQVMKHENFGDEIKTGAYQPLQLAPLLRSEFGNYFDQVVTTASTENRLLTWGDQKLKFTGNFMEPGITEMLSLKMLEGSANTLGDPTSILLSESTVKAVFGDQPAMNQLLKIDGQMEVLVSGIYEDLPENSTFANLNFIASWELVKKDLPEWIGWGNSWFSVYAQLAEGVDVETASAAIKDVRRIHLDAEYALKTKPVMFVQPMSKWRLFSRFENGVNTGGKIEYIWIFGVIGIFILILACINFMNLSTARSEKRAREVGIRKTIGSERNQLVGQFLSESFLVVSIAFIVAVLLAWLSLPNFNLITEKNVDIPWSRMEFWIISVIFIIIIGMLAGSYPAFYLSSFKPINVLKGVFKMPNTFTPRRILVTLQFVVSVALIIGTLVIFRQLEHAKDRPIGYNQDNIITVPIKTPEIMHHFESLKQELLESGNVRTVAASDVTITATYTTNSGFTWKGKDPNFSDEFNTLRATHGFGELVGWEIKEGRDFSREFGTDSLAFILNETAVEYMGLENPVGELIQWGKNGTFQVIGVIKDMITTSPYDPVRPMIYVLHEGRFINYVNLKINPERSVREALTSIENVFKKYDPANPFEYQFIDQEYAKKFGDEERLATLASYFALLAIFISCIGLLGISALVTEQRKKEIGVRKILGASIRHLWVLLSGEFFKLVIISSAIAIPLAYYYMSEWLEKFDYRTNLTWWIFAAGGLLAIVITVLTVSFHTMRAVIANPVDALRNE
jgi:putative ABC transport system permease protein